MIVAAAQVTVLRDRTRLTDDVDQSGPHFSRGAGRAACALYAVESVRRWSSLALALPFVVTACALFADLGGFSDGADAPVDAASEVIIAEASTDAPLPDVDADAAGDAGDAEAGDRYRAEVIADEPIVYYRLADLGDDAVDDRDVKTARFAGGVTKNVQSLVGVAGDRAVTLDGTGRIVVGPLPGLLVAKNPFSIEAWIRPSAGASGTDMILARDDVSAARYGVSLFVNAGEGVVIERWNDGGNNGRAVGVQPATTRPSHVVATYDGTALRVFVDGVAGSPSASTITVPYNTVAIVIGSQSAQFANFFEGSIDEVAIYDKVLPEPRIAAHYAAGKP